ncbi:YifB family Mg chelatase-like AAA ATPase [Humidisolicoccus flavus]|uniref:YifB family Mg chelatase-like AAA ATPase n=1 Tax=Humidisolicoccus flavus TaxID=3111414 RepID=UPI00324FACF9
MTTVGIAHSIVLAGLNGTRISVEAQTSAGLPSVTIIGLPDAALRQARERAWAAMQSSGLKAPDTKCVINLSPASLPKHGASFDVAIAVAVLRSTGVIPEGPDTTMLFGELSLDGRLRPGHGILPAVLGARRAGAKRVVVPAANLAEASLIDGVSVVGARSLRDVAIELGAEAEFVDCEALVLAVPAQQAEGAGDLSEVRGNLHAVEALQVAAAGGHHMMLLGPPGAGKTMLAQRLAGILPRLDEEAAIEVASLRSLSGLIQSGSLPRDPPFEAPHHTATSAALVGGGSGIIRPGSAVRASHGVLFLDESPEFRASVLDTLRQPLESGRISIARASGTAEYPASFQLVLAANPCPCGLDGSGDCVCSSIMKRRYLGRLSGPLLDRIDLHLRLDRVGATEASLSTPITSAQARARVSEARARSAHRLAGTPWKKNGEVPGPWLRKHGRAPESNAIALLDQALERGLITMRGYDRVARVAWSCADLDEVPVPDAHHFGRALLYRKGISS